jgi:hypothetical protein
MCSTVSICYSGKEIVVVVESDVKENTFKIKLKANLVFMCEEGKLKGFKGKTGESESNKCRL